MSGSLDHSPADVVRQLLVDLSFATMHTDGGAWPAYVGRVPDSPDEMMVLTDTAGRDSGRTSPDDERQEHYGFQVMLRANTHEEGYAKANEIAIALDKYTTLEGVSIDNAGTAGDSVYLIYAITRTTGVIPLGRESPASDRRLFTINALVALRQTS
jgi:hypothetical protein